MEWRVTFQVVQRHRPTTNDLYSGLHQNHSRNHELNWMMADGCTRLDGNLETNIKSHDSAYG